MTERLTAVADGCLAEDNVSLEKELSNSEKPSAKVFPWRKPDGDLIRDVDAFSGTLEYVRQPVEFIESH